MLMRGHHIVTYTGHKVFFDEVSADDIFIEDIAHALAHLCRFTGHTNMFYSVAQHSLLVAERVAGGPETKLIALLHDAAEAYVGDVSSPLKKWMQQKRCWAYESLHDTILARVHERFGIHRGSSLGVKAYDQAATLFEASGFMGLTYKELEKVGWPMNLWKLWEPWDPLDFAAENVDREFGDVITEFIHRFETLMKATGREELI